MGDPRAADLNQALPTPLAFGAEQAGADVLPNEWKQSFLTTGKHTEAWCSLHELNFDGKGDGYSALWEISVTRLSFFHSRSHVPGLSSVEDC